MRTAQEITEKFIELREKNGCSACPVQGQCNGREESCEELIEMWVRNESEKDYRAYISGPMTGVENYEKKFRAAEKDLTTYGFKAVNPVKLEELLPGGDEYEEYMRINMLLLDTCDNIYMLKGWQKSPGANRELGYAMAKGMTIIYEEGAQKWND